MVFRCIGFLMLLVLQRIAYCWLFPHKLGDVDKVSYVLPSHEPPKSPWDVCQEEIEESLGFTFERVNRHVGKTCSPCPKWGWGQRLSPTTADTSVLDAERYQTYQISVTKTWPAKYILNLGLCSSNVAAHHSIQCNSARLTASWRQSAVFTRNELKAYESYEASTGTVHMHTHKCTINYKHTHTHSFVLFIIRRVFIYIPIKENLYNTSQTIDKDIYGWTCV